MSFKTTNKFFLINAYSVSANGYEGTHAINKLAPL